MKDERIYVFSNYKSEDLSDRCVFTSLKDIDGSDQVDDCDYPIEVYEFKFVRKIKLDIRREIIEIK
jgi:hypothetical protein